MRTQVQEFGADPGMVQRLRVKRNDKVAELE
jgi:hypothetical protein